MGVPIGVRNLYVAILKTDDKNGATYDKPVHLAKAVEISVKPNVSSTTFYADDQASESESTLADIEVEITVDQIGSKNAAMLLGAKVDENGVLVWNRDDQAPYVAFGYQGSESGNAHTYVWLLKGKFALPEESRKTKGESIEYQPPKLTAKFLPRDYDGDWKRTVNSGDENIPKTVIETWFDQVYEKKKVVPPAGGGTK
ncbi:major tail protein [Paenibacillus larvae]|uniref:Major tail protein n=10 Tax=root TaxID=1 RepID=A0A0K2CZA3_9CAUD|nr:major tail protein [Paenibacillus larvae]YP_009193824.1 major tail protein [Paenibacillus phage Harrison]YP_009196110.1 major tail protein [Paenibacillus phage Vegas]ALA12577.1 major tail protein [Paenibacillus phage Paisley]ALA12747.1 major tail protein [Paenibacillus phage Hayley]ALA12831.1 major tail protein [Paenibacillus phage Vadim]ALA12917.1 major tail protein [Paenibacillus phage Diane]UYE92036.1 major tail protein [Paenibacillus phage LunBun]UYE92118.1 major tail protein [Paenib